MATDLMKKMIVRIAEDELTPCNGAVPKNVDDATTFTDMVISDNTDKGVLTNCIKEELVWRCGTGRDSVCGLTESGFAMYQTLKGLV